MSDHGTFEEAFPPNRTFGRTLPHSLEAEEHLLSCCLLDGPDVMPRCIMAGIGVSDFYDSKHGIIFEALGDLYRTQKPTTIDVVVEELKTRKQFEQVGGYPFLLQVSHGQPTTARTSYFIEKVREQSMLRDIIRAGTGIVEDCYGYSGGIEDFTSSVADKMMRVTGRSTSAGEEPIQTVAQSIIDEFSQLPEERKSTAAEVSWGLHDMDKACGRMPPGGLVILAGMPSTGKSALADRIAWRTSELGGHVLMFTYEMTKRDKAKRIAQQESRLSCAKFDDSPLDMKYNFREAVQRIRDSKTLHVFENDKTINRVAARCKSFASRAKVTFVVVDFLQYLARLEPTLRDERSDEKIARITGALKQVAKDCDCPVLLLSSLNRGSYKDGERPTMAGLRGSGDIESDADVIVILHWPQTNPGTGESQDPRHGGTQFYVEANQDKGRNSGVHQVPLTFHRDITLFENFSQ